MLQLDQESFYLKSVNHGRPVAGKKFADQETTGETIRSSMQTSMTKYKFMAWGEGVSCVPVGSIIDSRATDFVELSPSITLVSRFLRVDQASG